MVNMKKVQTRKALSKVASPMRICMRERLSLTSRWLRTRTVRAFPSSPKAEMAGTIRPSTTYLNGGASMASVSSCTTYLWEEIGIEMNKVISFDLDHRFCVLLLSLILVLLLLLLLMLMLFLLFLLLN